MNDKFELDTSFLNEYTNKQPKFNSLGYVTYKRTYARPLDNGKSEEWIDTVQRVVEGTFTIQKKHYTKNNIKWDESLAQKNAQEMFQRMWDFKFTPPGRGLWMMGTKHVEKNGASALNNCGFISTENIKEDFAEPFCFLMDMSMLGVGVGGDTKGEGEVTIIKPIKSNVVFMVEDSREGWVDLIRTILNAYVGKNEFPGAIRYDNVRPYGAPIKGFGGVSSGPDPLKNLVVNLENLLNNRIGQKITSSDIVDIFNFIGKCVVSGNVRRSAEIMFGDPEDDAFLSLKDPETNKEELYDRRWASNNSIFATVGMDYTKVANLTSKNGEPGYEWLRNAQQYSRMNGVVDDKDCRASGGNPCLEQTLESYELCCLVETYPSNHETLLDWVSTLYYAFMYAKSVTLLPTHNQKTNEVMARNRRIGCSISGIVQAFKKFGRRESLKWFDKGYNRLKQLDKSLSERFGVPQSVKITSIKPSGTVSLLAGVTPGIHYPQSEYYIRNVRIQGGTPLLEQLKKANYTIEPDKYSENTFVVSFPVKEEFFDRTVDQVSMWEQLENAAQIQTYWADNQVSVTINFKPEEAKDIKYALELYETRLKGVSFLPLQDHGYEQAPYIPISKEKYEEMVKEVKDVDFTTSVHDTVEKFCDTGTCSL